MRRTLLQISFLFLTLGLMGQDLRPGFILSLENDTVFGFVVYRESYQRFESCDFKPDPEQPVQLFKPGQINGYGFIGDRFFKTFRLQPENQDTLEVFVEILLEGDLSLLKYQHLYFAHKAGEVFPFLVSSEEKIIEKEGKTFFKDSKRHIGVLTYLMMDCPEMQERIRKIYPNEKKLTQLFEAYHKCRDLPFEMFKEDKPWLAFEFGAALALAPTWFRYGDYVEQDHFNFTNRLLKTNFSTSYSPGIGFFMDARFSRLQERMSLYSGLLYQFRSFHSYEENTFSQYSESESLYWDIDLHEFKIPLGIKYTFYERNFTPYIMLGGSLTNNFKCDHRLTKERISDGKVIIDVSPALSFKRAQLGLWAGAGVFRPVFQQYVLFLEVRSEFTDGITMVIPYDEFRSHLFGIQFIGGIKF